MACPSIRCDQRLIEGTALPILTTTRRHCNPENSRRGLKSWRVCHPPSSKAFMAFGGTVAGVGRPGTQRVDRWNQVFPRVAPGRFPSYERRRGYAWRPAGCHWLASGFWSVPCGGVVPEHSPRASAFVHRQCKPLGPLLARRSLAQCTSARDGRTSHWQASGTRPWPKATLPSRHPS
jgi:hypothetical protein